MLATDSYSTLSISNNKEGSTDLTNLHLLYSKFVRAHQGFNP